MWLRHADAVRTQGMRQLMSVLMKYAPPSHLLSLCGLFFLSLPTHTPILNNFPLLSYLPKELGRQERRGQSSTSSNEGLLCETPKLLLLVIRTRCDPHIRSYRLLRSTPPILPLLHTLPSVKQVFILLCQSRRGGTSVMICLVISYPSDDLALNLCSTSPSR